MKPSIHNPDKLTPEQYGAADGWRLLYQHETMSVPEGTECWGGVWSPTLYGVGERMIEADSSPDRGSTYRTRTPDPHAAQPHDPVAEVIAHARRNLAELNAVIAQLEALAKGGAK